MKGIASPIRALSLFRDTNILSELIPTDITTESLEEMGITLRQLTRTPDSTGEIYVESVPKPEETRTDPNPDPADSGQPCRSSRTVKSGHLDLIKSRLTFRFPGSLPFFRFPIDPLPPLARATGSALAAAAPSQRGVLDYSEPFFLSPASLLP